jgi:hypothetical protein
MFRSGIVGEADGNAIASGQKQRDRATVSLTDLVSCTVNLFTIGICLLPCFVLVAFPLPNIA